MNALECIKGRRAIRKFTDKPVTKEVLESVIDTARFAPSWKNTQIARYVALTGKAKAALADTCFEAWKGNTTIVNNAPMVIVETYVKGRCGFEPDGSFSPPRKTVGRITTVASLLKRSALQHMRRDSAQLSWESSMKRRWLR